jgi:dTDP-4-amino-4,6-dideoxygalactose transaminase
VVRFNNEKKRDEVQERLRLKGIGTGVHYLPNYLFKPYENCIRIDNCKNTEEFYRTCLSLPMHLHLTDDNIVEVVKTIEEVL